MHELTTDRVVILGAGIAGLYAALKLAPRPVLLISPDPLGTGASSAWAQGGVAAAMDPADHPGNHAADTIRAGAGIVDETVARLVTREAPAAIADLSALGAPFDRDPQGGYVLSREAAHGFARVVRVQGDQAGAQITRALVARVRATPSVQVLEDVMAIALGLDGGRVGHAVLAGAGTATGAKGPGPFRLHAPAFLLAGGGAGGLYAVTTNPPRISGQAVGMAARAGAVIADAEFVQFHPTALDCGIDPAPLVTEALRGEGARLINREGERFMEAIHTDAELAPRDIVARAIHAQAMAGMRPALDARGTLGERILRDFPAVAAACARAGIDPVSQPIPVATAAHYHMGGVACDLQGRSSLPGLWVCGETAATGLHGANRLASNGLLEALVFARRCAASIRDALPERGIAPPVTPPASEPASGCALSMPDPALVQRLRNAMTRDAGVIRDAAGLRRCLQEIAEIEAARPDCAPLLNMTATATLIVASALLREESRGAHYRSDFPATAAAGRRSCIRLADALTLRLSLEDIP